MDISERKRLILKTIVSLHTDSGDPVGSKILNTFLANLSVSSATLRNEMAEMTALGLLEQPHTSAGRVPTMAGYRYYVEHLMKPKPLLEEEKEYIRQTVREMDSDPDKAAQSAARALCEIASLAAVATTPQGGNVQITHFSLMKTGRYNVAVMGVSSVGSLKTRVCRTGAELSDDHIRRMEALLNQQLVFVSAEDVTPQRLASVYALLGGEGKLLEPILAAAASIIQSASDVHVFIDGQQRLLAYRELDGHIKELLELFSDRAAMRSWLSRPESLKVIVGDENGELGLDALSTVVGRYRAAGGRFGALAVAGPIRMNYGYIVPRLNYFCETMSAALTNPAG